MRQHLSSHVVSERSTNLHEEVLKLEGVIVPLTGPRDVNLDPNESALKHQLKLSMFDYSKFSLK